MLSSALRWLGMEEQSAAARSNRFYNQQAIAKYPVPFPGALDTPRQESPLDWFGDESEYPVVERSDKVPESGPGSHRQLGPSVSITHGDNPLYWSHKPLQGPCGPPEVASLVQVCRLLATQRFHNVLPGVYEVVWRIALSKPVEFDARWSVRVMPGDEEMVMARLPENPKPDSTYVCDLDIRHHSPQVRFSALRDMESVEGFVHTQRTTNESRDLQKKMEALATPMDTDPRYLLLRVGLVEVTENPSTVVCQVVGGNCRWCHGLDIHYVELKKVRMPWSCERLLWAAQKEGSESPIGKLPPVLLRDIISICSRSPSADSVSGNVAAAA